MQLCYHLIVITVKFLLNAPTLINAPQAVFIEKKINSPDTLAFTQINLNILVKVDPLCKS